MRQRLSAVAVLFLFLSALPAFAQYQWGRPHPPRAGACFYQDPQFRGDYFCLKAGERWPSMPAGFNDRITSIRVFGGARLRVFNDAGLRGISLLLDRDVDDLRRIPVNGDPFKNWNDRISSLVVFTDRDEWEERRVAPMPEPVPPPPGDDWRRDRDSWHPGERDSACTSRPGDGARWCDNFRGVHEARPVREFGRRACEFNRNWGIERGHLWVSDGCSAVFEYR